MGKPKAPAAPNYAAAATAQGTANVDSALATNALNTPNQVTPYGSLTYTQSAKGSGQGYTTSTGQYIPQTTVTQTFSPDQQKLYDQQTGLSEALNDLSARGIGFVSDATKTPITADQFKPLSNGPAAPTGYINSVDLASYLTGVTPSSFQTSVSGGNNLTTGVTGGPLANNVGVGSNLTTGVSAGPLQTSYNFSGVGAMPSSSDFGAQRDQVTNALMSRLQPQIDADRQAQEASLANQGISLGSAAYDTANRLQERNINDQRTSALLAGSQEQQRLFEDAMGVRQQGVNEAVQQGNFYNTAQGQNFQQQLANAGLNNSAQGQLFNQGLANANLFNSAQAQKFGQDTSNANLNNSAQDTFFQHGLANANLANNAAAQSFSQGQANLADYNTAQDQNYAQRLENANLNNTNLNQQFQNGLASSQFNNQAIAQAIQQADYFKNQPLNMLNSLRTGNNSTMPTFGNFATGTQIGAAPVYQATTDAANFANQQYQNKMNLYGSMLSGLGSLGSTAIKTWG